MMQIRLSSQTFSRVLLTAALMVVSIVLMAFFAEKASAHGWVDSPASRAILCKQGQNTDCGAIVYEPQSLEAPKGFPQSGPADGKIASAGGLFPKLDEQSANRWTKVAISGGQTTFTWKFTAAHATTSFRYFITKPNWNPNQPLTRAQFDLTPFCTQNYNGQQPPFTYSHTCNVPSDRTGYHVILAVWDIADTANAFYNVIDVNFQGGGSSDTQAPTAPSNLRAANVGATSVSLSWGASSDNVGVTGYRIYSGSNVIATVSGSALSYDVTGLTSSTTYTFKVTALDAAGNESAASNTVTVTTGSVPVDNSPPTAPTGLHVMGTPGSNSVHLMWGASTDNVGVAGYRIYQGGTLVATVNGTTLEKIVTGLAPDTTYTFTVRAYDAAGNESANSNAVSVKTAPPPAATPWAPNTSYTVGQLVSYNGLIYQCRQSHTSLPGWEPPNVPALWLQV